MTASIARASDLRLVNLEDIGPHYATTLRTDATYIAEAATNPLAPSANGAAQPLMKSRVVYRFQNTVAYHWYNDLDTGRYSFRQFIFEGDESIAFGSVLQRFGGSVRHVRHHTSPGIWWRPMPM